MLKKTLIASATVLSIAMAMPLTATAHAQQAATMGQNGQAEMMKKQGHNGGAGMGQPGMKQGGMSQGGMGQSGMKQGGMSQGGMGKMKMMKRMMKMRKMMMGKMFMVRQKPYSNNDIKRMIDGRLAKHGFSKLIAGSVANGSDEFPKTAIVNVTSPKGELLFKVEVNRKNGMAAIIE